MIQISTVFSLAASIFGILLILFSSEVDKDLKSQYVNDEIDWDEFQFVARQNEVAMRSGIGIVTISGIAFVISYWKSRSQS